MLYKRIAFIALLGVGCATATHALAQSGIAQPSPGAPAASSVPSGGASKTAPSAPTAAPPAGVEPPGTVAPAAAPPPSPGPVALAREKFDAACPQSACDAAVQKEQAAALNDALKAATLGDIPVILELVDVLAGIKPKTPAVFAGFITGGKQAATRVADRELKTRLDERRWGDARGWIAAQEARLGVSWGKVAHAAEARALEALARAVKPPTPLDALVALVDEYASVVAVPTADASVKRAFTLLQGKVGSLVDPMMQARLASYDYEGANGLVSTYASQAGDSWRKGAASAIAKKQSVTTELVDSCSKEKTWEACRGALDELVSACSSDLFTCNATAKVTLLQRFVPMFSKEPANDELLLEIGRAVRGVPSLKAQDALKQLGAQADGIVRPHVEASVRATTKESNYSGAKQIAQPYAEDFGEKWLAQMNAAVDGEERRQIAIAEAQERAREAAENAKKQACYGQCMGMVIACGSGPYFRGCGIFDQCCTPAPSDCQNMCNIVGGW